MGLKGLQLTGNSIVPQLLHLGTPLVDRFQTHAEQFNQNINSLGFGSANLTRQSVSLFQQYIAIALLFGIQAADLRTYQEEGHYDGRVGLSPATASLYEVVFELCDVKFSGKRAFVHNDSDQSLESYIAIIANDVVNDGKTCHAVSSIVEDMIHGFDP